MGNTIPLMEILKSWLAGGKGRGAALAKHLKVPASFVTKMANGERPIPMEHGAGIEVFTQGVVSRKAVWPHDWRRIWPEMELLPSSNSEEGGNVQ